MTKITEYEDGHVVAFACPHCDHWHDLRIEAREEATVGGFSELPHVICVKCRKCVGCGDWDTTTAGVYRDGII